MTDRIIGARTPDGTQRKPLCLSHVPVQKERAPMVGELMPAGMIYAGISSDNGKPLFTTPADLPETMVWFDAMRIASRAMLHGRNDWRVPTSRELEWLYQNRNAIGGFNERGFACEGWYWSSTSPIYGLAWARRFRDGSSDTASKLSLLSVRLIRG